VKRGRQLISFRIVVGVNLGISRKDAKMKYEDAMHFFSLRALRRCVNKKFCTLKE